MIPNQSKPSAVHLLFSSLKPYKFVLFACVLISVLVTAVDLGFSYVIKQAINMSTSSESQDVLSWLKIMIGLIIGGTLLKYFAKMLSVRISAYLARDLQSKLIDKVVKLPLTYLQKHSTGSIVSRQSSDLIQIQNFLQNDLFNLLYYPLLIIGSMSFMAILSWKLLLFCTFITPLSIALMVFVSKPLSTKMGQLQENLSKSNAIVHDAISGITILKAYRLQSSFSNKYRSSLDNVLRNAVSVEKTRAMSSPIIVILRIVPFIFCILYGGYMSVEGALSLGALAGFIQLLNYLVQPSSQMPMLINSLRATMGVLGHFSELLSEPEERSGGRAFNPVPGIEPIRFQDLSFHYGTAQPVLNRLDLSLKEKSVTAIVGPSGSGKTTIFQLICGFYEPEDGEYSLLGHRIQEYDLKSARSKIAMVPQKPHLFPVTVSENISYGNPDASREEIIEAAKLAYAHDFIMGLQEGYDTVLGEQGLGLSGGQKQRIALARAIVKDAPILLLDEATSALDTISEALIQQSIKVISQDKTVVIIAHRLSTIENADQIKVLNQGQIVETGNHQELLQQKGLYASLYEHDFVSSEAAENGGSYVS